jgi:hypothetical protein
MVIAVNTWALTKMPSGYIFADAILPGVFFIATFFVNFLFKRRLAKE